MANLDPLLLGVAMLIAGVIASRFISEAGLRRLTPEQKVAVLDAFALQRKYSILIVLGIAVALYRTPRAFISVLILYFIGSAFLSIRRLSRLALPSAYRNSYLAAQTAQGAGIGAYIVVMTSAGLL